MKAAIKKQLLFAAVCLLVAVFCSVLAGHSEVMVEVMLTVCAPSPAGGLVGSDISPVALCCAVVLRHLLPQHLAPLLCFSTVRCIQVDL
jgi:hypothetical protein